MFPAVVMRKSSAAGMRRAMWGGWSDVGKIAAKLTYRAAGSDRCVVDWLGLMGTRARMSQIYSCYMTIIFCL